MSMDQYPIPFDWPALMPILIVFGAGVVAMAIEMIRPRQTNNAIVWTCLLGLGGAAYFLIMPLEPRSAETMGGLFISDKFGIVMQLMLVAVTFLTVVYSEGYLRERRLAFGEYYPLLLWSATGGMIMATSRDLLIILLGLEVLSISLYILAGLSSGEKKSQESALKYFLLGAFASGFLLYGIALIYGATGTTHVSGMGALMARDALDSTNIKLLYGGFGLVLVGLGFKAALVPFHMWTPDVYQGAPTSVTGFMAAGSKIAAFAVLFRFLDASFALSALWLPIMTGLAVLTMTLGNLVALVQRDAKRILAYSSIAHAGYVLVAVVAYGWLKGSDSSIDASTILYYLAAYGIMTVGAFAVLSLSAKAGSEGTTLEDLAGLWQRAPFPAMMMIVFMASLAGIPPTAGFFGKFLIFKDALDAGLLWLALLLALNSVFSVFYYLRIVAPIVVGKPDFHKPRFAGMNAGLFVTCALCAAGIIILGLAVEPILEWVAAEAPMQAQL